MRSISGVGTISRQARTAAGPLPENPAHPAAHADSVARRVPDQAGHLRHPGADGIRFARRARSRRGFAGPRRGAPRLRPDAVLPGCGLSYGRRIGRGILAVTAGENERRILRRDPNPYLFRPLTIRSVTVKNRIMLSPMC